MNNNLNCTSWFLSVARKHLKLLVAKRGIAAALLYAFLGLLLASSFPFCSVDCFWFMFSASESNLEKIRSRAASFAYIKYDITL